MQTIYNQWMNRLTTKQLPESRSINESIRQMKEEDSIDLEIAFQELEIKYLESLGY